jgi:hypothetical protein
MPIFNLCRLLLRVGGASFKFPHNLKMPYLRASKMNYVVTNLLKPQTDDDVFPELALSLYAFTESLYQRLKKNKIRDVYFLSREGQPLMQLFEAYQQARPDNSQDKICCHYLEVSRRSTFLPSLGTLETERFETLFRQYRAISILEFLASLGLESHSGDTAKALMVEEDVLAQRMADLPTDPLYRSLLDNPWFQRLYESERLTRRAAFIGYITALSGGKLPDVLHLVDVGWKGTIQDNLYTLLCKQSLTDVQGIEGYYVGLVAMGAADAANRKHGLLFSCASVKSTGFRVFNENRALFEVILAADHGSVESYVFDKAGKAGSVRSEFEEELMVKKWVVPLQKKLMARFDALIKHLVNMQYEQEWLIKMAAAPHARMVFNPTKYEMDWFSTVFHVENFGVFENSTFDSSHNVSGFVDRVAFTLRLIFRPGSIDFGFWPWLSIRRRSFTGFAYAYRFIRGRVFA